MLNTHICSGICFNTKKYGTNWRVKELTDIENVKCQFCSSRLCLKCAKYNPVYSEFWCKKYHYPVIFFRELENLYVQLVLNQDIWDQLNLIIDKFYTQEFATPLKLPYSRYGYNKTKKSCILWLLVNYCPMKYIYYKINQILGYNDNYSKNKVIKSYTSHCRWNYFNYLNKISKVIEIIFKFIYIPNGQIYYSLKSATKQCKYMLVKKLVKYFDLDTTYMVELLFLSNKRNCANLSKILHDKILHDKILHNNPLNTYS